MPDMSVISALMSSLKAAKDIAESSIGLAQAEATRGKIFEFQSKMLDAQQFAFAAQEERAALAETVRDLKEQLAKLENWTAEKERYELGEIASGVFAYALKEGMHDLEPPHCLCVACYQEAKKSILQRPNQRNSDLFCPRCKTVLVLQGLGFRDR